MRKIGLVALVVSVGVLAAGASVARAHQSAQPATHRAAAHPALHAIGGLRIPGVLKVPGVLNSQPVGLSLNWSGYGDTSKLGRFTYVHSKFQQPAITCNGTKNDWTSEWVGLDGFNDETVEQDGTFSFCGGKDHRTPAYVAWYEMFPAASVSVFSVRPGDWIESVVRYANGKFTLTISDLTSHRSASHTASCGQCKRLSAEWIEERPALCNNTETRCFITALADFHTAVMTQNWASINGGSPHPISRYANTPLDIVQPLKNHGLEILAQTNPLTDGGSTFSITWERRGGIVPITL
jgi:hypothetical protein